MKEENFALSCTIIFLVLEPIRCARCFSLLREPHVTLEGHTLRVLGAPMVRHRHKRGCATREQKASMPPPQVYTGHGRARDDNNYGYQQLAQTF